MWTIYKVLCKSLCVAFAIHPAPCTRWDVISTLSHYKLKQVKVLVQDHDSYFEEGGEDVVGRKLILLVVCVVDK